MVVLNQKEEVKTNQKENKKMSEIDLIGNTIMIGMIVFILLCLFVERFRP